MGEFENRYFTGALVFGDDFDEDAIRRWYEEEEHGYYDLVQSYETYAYGCHALNEFQAFRFLREKYRCCLAMGCARGDDVARLARQVEQFVAIEPAEQWWQSEIHGTPAVYMKPSLAGDIPLSDGHADLAVCFGVLHHIPNASHVLSEMARVLRPGGHLLLREPISAMGDWRKPRRGLTPNERGFPPGWIDSQARGCGLTLIRKRYCCFPPISRLANILHSGAPYNSPTMVRIDAVLSGLFSWNLHYYRDSFFKKCAPGDAFYMFCKHG